MVKPKEENHSDFSPSSMQRFILCPASWKMTKDLKKESSPAAEEGTMLHKRVVNKDFRDLNNEQIKAVEACIDFIDYLNHTGDYKNSVHELEVNIYNSDFKILTYGTFDFGLVSSDMKKGILTDWKFGRNKVNDSGENWQIATYALGMHQKYGVEEVEAYIFQPRIYPNRSVYTYRNFDVIQKKLEEARAKCEADEMIFIAGDEQCKYCPAKNFCPAYIQKFNKVLSLSQSINLADDKKSNMARIKAKIADIPNEPLKDYYEDIKLFDSVSKEVKDEFEGRVRKNGVLLGYGLKDNAPTKSITNINGLYGFYKNLITQGELLGTAKIQKGECEKLIINRLKTQAELKGEKVKITDLKKQFNAEIEPFCTVESRKPYVVKL